MKTGLCPKCGSNHLYVSSDSFVRYTAVELDVYVCLNCRYTELYVSDDVPAHEIATRWSRYHPDASIGQPTIRLPPLEIDGAQIIYHGTLRDGVTPTINDFYRFPDGTLQRPAQIALGQYHGDIAVQRFYCDDHWNVLTKRASGSLEQALSTVDREYVGATAKLQKV